MLCKLPTSSKGQRAFTAPRGHRADARRQRQARQLLARVAPTKDAGRRGSFNPPTVAETKQKFLDAYDKPVSSLYNTVVQELLVQQHFMRHNSRYQYDEVFALGISSVFSQVLDDMSPDEADQVFSAYINALDEDPKQYKKDAEKLTELGKACDGPGDLKPDASGSEVQKVLAGIKDRAENSKFFYTRFFAIGLFRLLELTSARDPKALETLVSSLGLKLDLVNKDLLLYKSILSKMNAAKELMAEFLEREQRKQKERDSEKAADKDSSEQTTGEAKLNETTKEGAKAEA